MKTKLLPALILLFSTLNVLAQNNLPKGSLLLGGNFNFSTGRSDANIQQKQRYTNYSISPSAAVAIKDNLFVGVNLGFNYAKNTNNYVNASYIDSVRSTSFIYGVFLRKYKPLKHNFSIYLQADLRGSNTDFKATNIVQSYYSGAKGFEANISLTPGISYGINSKLQVEAGLNNLVYIGYDQTKYKQPAVDSKSTKENNFTVSTSLNNFTSQLFFGFRFLLQKKAG